MPHVSRHAPTKKISDKIFERMLEAMTTKGSLRDRQNFILDMLTPTERIMLSKRFAVVYMLTKGYSFSDIQETLRISPSTINRIWDAIQRDKYSSIVARIGRVGKKGDMVDIVQWIADLLPPMRQSKSYYTDRMRRLNL
jgi:uncharacterized protein YerC